MITVDRRNATETKGCRLKALALLPFLVLAWLVLASGAGHAQEAEWRYNYDAARREAIDKNKAIFIDFGTSWCMPCRKLEATTFRDPAIAAIFHDYFVLLKIDPEKEVALAQALRVTSYPTMVMAAPDGKILVQLEGFHEPAKLMPHLQKVVNLVSAPEWMQKDFDAAGKALANSDFSQAIALLKRVTEDNKQRPVQVKATQLLKEIEDQAAGRLARARQLMDKGQVTEAMETTTELVRIYAGSQAAVEGGRMLTSLGGRQETQEAQRSRRARELMALAREDYRTKDYLCCLNRCQLLMSSFADLPEGGEATQLAGEIKNNPEWMQSACDALTDQLGVLYLSLADSWLKKGQPDQAQVYLEKVIQSFPNSRQAELAQVRLAQIQGHPTRPVNFKRSN